MSLVESLSAGVAGDGGMSLSPAGVLLSVVCWPSPLPAVDVLSMSLSLLLLVVVVLSSFGGSSFGLGFGLLTIGLQVERRDCQINKHGFSTSRYYYSNMINVIPAYGSIRHFKLGIQQNCQIMKKKKFVRMIMSI